MHTIKYQNAKEGKVKMTDHNLLKMRKADREIKDKELIQGILDICPVCTLAIHDKPYPYEVPMNYGYLWSDRLTIYLHMSLEGHKISLLKKNANVSCNMYAFLDRSNSEEYRGEHQDYRSVNIFGKAEILTLEQPEEFLEGLNAIQKHYKRNELKTVPINKNLGVVKIVADAVTAKAMYPITKISEVAMPENER